MRSHAGFEMASSRAALGHVAKTYQHEILDVVASDARWASWAETFATSVCRVPVRRHASTFERRVPVIFGLRPVERDARLGARRQQERHPRRDSVICASASDRRDAERGRMDHARGRARERDHASCVGVVLFVPRPRRQSVSVTRLRCSRQAVLTRFAERIQDPCSRDILPMWKVTFRRVIVNIFELIKDVLDESFGDVYGDNESDRAEKVKAALKGLSEHYGNLLNGGASPDYRDAATRVGYVVRYVTCHACIVDDVISLKKLRELGKLFEGEVVQVACIGGGPGSDFLGILKHMTKKDLTATLKCYLLDREQAWGDTWSDVDMKLRGGKFRVSTHFQVLDVGDADTWTIQNKYLKCDLFSMVYFVSEVWSIRQKARAYFAHLFRQAKAGAYFLYIDNDVSEFSDWFDRLAADAGLELVFQEPMDARLPSDEQKESIRKYIEMVGYPKLTAKVDVRVYRRPSAPK